MINSIAYSHIAAAAAAAAAKSLQSCLTLCDPIDVSPQVETLALYSLVAEDFIIDRY